MSWLEWVSALITAGGFVASILGAWVTYAARWNGERTRELQRQLHNDTLAVLERMDQRADERHRETIEAIRALRA
jgi:hypothetical protein